MSCSHLFHLSATPAQFVSANGSRIDVTQDLFSVLKGMSLSFLSLHPKGFREPHWHPNANELGYCLEGKALMTIFSPGASHDTFIIEPGTLAFVPKGYLHHLQNIGEGSFKMLLCFNDAHPEDLNLSSAIGCMPARALGSTFNLPSTFFDNLNRSVRPVFIGEHPQADELSLAWQTNRFKLNIEATHPQVETQGGLVKMSNSFILPTLEGLAMYSLTLAPKGVREPHWHPNAHELNYVIKGRVRITLLSPGEQVDTFEMEAGDMSFLPQGYFHSIENLGEESAQMTVFFNHVTPSDIGLSGCLGAYPNELLADLFRVPTSYFESLPKYQEDLLVVAGGG